MSWLGAQPRSTGRGGMGRAIAALLAVAMIGSTSVGCMALRLSSRGAPENEMRELEIELGQVDLSVAHGPEHNEHGHSEHGQPAPLWTTAPVSGWVHGFDYHLVDGRGQPLPKEVLHHFKVMAPDRRELFSPLMLRVVGAGSETSSKSLPRQVGYRIEEGDSLLVTAMLANPTGKPLHGVRLRILLRYSPEGRWQPPLDVVPFFTHVTQPSDDSSYDLPPGRSEKSIEVTPAVSGRILALGGHLHRYGESIQLADAATGSEIWETRAKRREDGSVVEIPYETFVWSDGPRLWAGHTYRITATYENPTGAAISQGGMGTLGGVIVPEGPWPDVDRRAPEYTLDMAREAGAAATHTHAH